MRTLPVNAGLLFHLFISKKCGQDFFEKQIIKDNPAYQQELEELEEFYLEQQNVAKERETFFFSDYRDFLIGQSTQP